VRRALLLHQVLNDSGAVVLATGTTNLVELRMQQLFQARSTGASAGVMKLDLEAPENGQGRFHRATFVRPNV
jgi:hypothetical protein